MKPLLNIVLLLVGWLSLVPCTGRGEDVYDERSLMDQLHALTDERWKDGEWKRNHAMYMGCHQLYVVEVIDPAAELHRDHIPRVRYRQHVKILKVLRGKAREEMMIGYTIDRKAATLSQGDVILIVGNSHRIGFNVIAVWMEAEAAEVLLRKAFSPQS
ncbi:hypothetical protein P3T73_16275 [Kiritimatiellota bacterium B12222]|nr:hypothetical protein P3T73_16275 [Kiritimatiellota bacterium B12222]